MVRRNFSKSVMVQRIKAATRNDVIYCEKCGLPAKKFQIDHINPDALTGEPTFENSMLMCIECHGSKTKDDVKNIAKAKRREAKHLGAVIPKGKIQSRGFAKKEKKEKLPLPPRKSIFE